MSREEEREEKRSTSIALMSHIASLVSGAGEHVVWNSAAKGHDA
jgi:hypothetical protein